VLLLDVPATSPAAKAGLQKDDVILACNGQPVRTMKDLQELRDEAATSIRQSNAKPLGSYRWLVWVVTPITSDATTNTTFAELQVIPAAVAANS